LDVGGGNEKCARSLREIGGGEKDVTRSEHLMNEILGDFIFIDGNGVGVREGGEASDLKKMRVLLTVDGDFFPDVVIIERDPIKFKRDGASFLTGVR
jgi:hypothetical protein